MRIFCSCLAYDLCLVAGIYWLLPYTLHSNFNCVAVCMRSFLFAVRKTFLSSFFKSSFPIPLLLVLPLAILIAFLLSRSGLACSLLLSLYALHLSVASFSWTPHSLSLSLLFLRFFLLSFSAMQFYIHKLRKSSYEWWKKRSVKAQMYSRMARDCNCDRPIPLAFIISQQQ